MRKTSIILKFWLIMLIIFIFVGIGITYLNQVFLPSRIKALILKGIEGATGKRASLASLKFSIFKGLVLKDLVIYGDTKPILKLKEGSCVFLIFPIFKKQIVIPALKLKSPELFVERRPDNSIDIFEPFLKKSVQDKKNDFNVAVYKINVLDARINFQDDTFSPAFTKVMDNLNISLYLFLPAKVKFALQSCILAEMPARIISSGEYNIAERKLVSKITVKDFSPKEFSSYYQNLGIKIDEGKINGLIELEFKVDSLGVGLSLEGKDFLVSKDKINAGFSLSAKAKLLYNLEDKQAVYSGMINIFKSELSGLDFIEKINEIKGEVKFDNTGLTSGAFSASIFNIPFDAKINPVDFNNPLVNVDIFSKLGLDVVSGLLKDKFKLNFPGNLKGDAELSVKIETKLPISSLPQINGALDISNARLKLDQISSDFEDINGRLQFSSSRVEWPALNFKYLDLDYKSNGFITNFQAPSGRIGVVSRDLSLNSDFKMKGKLVEFSEFKGKYTNSAFSLTGGIDLTDSSSISADINAKLDIDLDVPKEIFKNLKFQIEQINPKGVIHSELKLKGNINEIKSCFINAKLSSSNLSLYGLKFEDSSLNYNQENGIAGVSGMRLSLYDGIIDASGKMNFNSDNLPYWISVDIQGLKIEKLKLDTAFKDKDLAGTINAQAKVNGFSGDLSKLSGLGKIIINDGKLWELNLFKGLGQLLFTKNFVNIVFSEGACGFTIQDKFIFTDNLKLKSNLSDITGSLKIGFDNSIDGSLNVEVLSDAPITGTIKDVTTAILGQAQKFGVIKVTGTLKEPSFKFKPSVVDIFKGLKDSLFKN